MVLAQWYRYVSTWEGDTRMLSFSVILLVVILGLFVLRNEGDGEGQQEESET